MRIQPCPGGGCQREYREKLQKNKEKRRNLTVRRIADSI
jgi:hypothetical protein